MMFDIRKIQEQVIFEGVKNFSDTETAKNIVYGVDGSAENENNPQWVKSTMSRLESQFNREEIKEIRINCQCGYGMDEKLSLVEELMAGASSLETFVNSEKAKAAGLFCVEGELYLQFYFCPCPILEEVDKLETNTWCQCTTGYSKVLFERAFNCEVDVVLLKSIKMGDSTCLMKIILKDLIWK